MRKILSFGLVVAAGLALSSPAWAVDKCHIPPPAWWNAPKYSTVYEGSRGSYAGAQPASHTFSAQRRSPQRYASSPFPFRDPFRR